MFNFISGIKNCLVGRKEKVPFRTMEFTPREKVRSFSESVNYNPRNIPSHFPRNVDLYTKIALDLTLDSGVLERNLDKLSYVQSQINSQKDIRYLAKALEEKADIIASTFGWSYKNNPSNKEYQEFMNLASQFRSLANNFSSRVIKTKPVRRYRSYHDLVDAVLVK